MFDFFSHLFDTTGFPPRWNCGRWSAGTGWLHICSDVGIWSAYLSIPIVIGYFVLRRRTVPFRGVFVLFAAFILACGSTHLMDAVIFWWPAYRLSGLMKLITALLSWFTVFALIKVTPQALAMRSPEELQREIDERKRAEAELAQRDEQLRQSHKLEAVGSLAGGIAHEFNNLLQAIRGYTRYAMEGLQPEDPRHQDLEQVVKASDRAATLTRELLGFSRHQVLERGNVDPRELVADLLKMLRPLIGEQIDVQVSLATDTGSLHADRGLLQQMLLNLCINARDAMPNGGRLIVKTQHVHLSDKYCDLHPAGKPGTYVMFSVADSGCGIPPEMKQRIFEPFFTTKGVGKGTGLGLAMVYGCVQQHGGTINFYSEPNLGTTFNIYLPVAADAGCAVDEVVTTPATGGKETILIAEDEPMVRDLAVRILARAGYAVLVAADGAEAVELFEANADDVSLVLLDAVMPKLTGHQAYDRIKLKNPTLPAVFCSGYDPEMGQVKLLMEEGVRMVQKPYDPDVLLRTVREVLDGQHLLETPTCRA